MRRSNARGPAGPRRLPEATPRPVRGGGTARSFTLPPAGILALILAAAFAAQASALRLPFFADDYLFLDQVRGRSLAGALAAPDPLRDFFWRPVGRQLYFGLIARAHESPLVAHAGNLALFLLVLALLFRLVHGLAGLRAAAVTTAIVALHHASDVPVRWVSGSQDLIAIAAALGALILVRSGRPWWASIALVVGLLAKETVVVTPLIALVMIRRPGERWTVALRRVAPMMGAVLVWGVPWLLVMRGHSNGMLHPGPQVVAAALAHFAQVALGLEWSGALDVRSFLHLPALVPLFLALAAVVLTVRGAAPTANDAAPRNVPGIGMGWAVLGALPAAAAVYVWSSYYYLFAMCGVALGIGAMLERRSRGIALVVVALLGLGSEHARRVEAFATVPGEWNTVSHFNRFYFDRSTTWISRYLADVMRRHPRLPHRSTVYFAGTPAFTSWQIADGAILRWAYHDPTIRSYYLSAFSLERTRRGPTFVFFGRGDSLVEVPPGPEGLRAVAITQTLADHYRVAHDALAAGGPDTTRNIKLAYCLAWVALARGDTAAAHRGLKSVGLEPDRTPASQTAPALRALAAGDTLAALRLLGEANQAHALDPAVHAVLADLFLRSSPQSGNGVVEALAARVLAPTDPDAWRRWASLQLGTANAPQAYRSLRRYFALAGPRGLTDVQAQRMMERLKETVPEAGLGGAGFGGPALRNPEE